MPQRRHFPELLLTIAGIGACVGASTLLALAFGMLDMSAPYLAFLPAVALCCMLDGFRAGSIAAVLSACSLWYFLIPPDGFALPDHSDAGHLLVFLGVATVVCWIIELQRRSNDQLAQENFELGYKVSLLRSFRSLRQSASR